MTAGEQIGNASLGWLELISGREPVQPRFSPDRAGLVTAVAVFGAASVLGTIVRGVARGYPSYTEVFIGLVIDLILLLLVLAVAHYTARLMRAPIRGLELVVPAAWAMALLWLLLVPLSLLDRIVYNALLGMLGFMLYRAGRLIARFGIGTAIAYAILSVLVLVALPLSLYMVLAPGPRPI